MKMKLKGRLKCSGILKIELDNEVELPLHASLIKNQKMHITLVHQSLMKEMTFSGKRLDKWLSKNQPDIELELELNTAEPFICSESDKESQVFFVTEDSQHSLDAFLKLYFDSLGLTKEFKEIKANSIDTGRRYHLSYANLTGNPGDSVSVVW